MQDRAEATRRAIIQAAAEQFDRKGYAAASVAAIARQAGCTSGALYFHFTGKDALAGAVIEAHFASWPPLVQQAQSVPAPALERLVTLSFAVVRAFRDDVVVRAGGRLWNERRTIDTHLPAPFVGWIATVTCLLQQAAAEGSLGLQVAPEQAAASVVCALFGVHSVSDALDGRTLVEERLAALWLLLLPGLTAHPDDAHALVERCRDNRLTTGPGAAQPVLN